MTTHEPLPLVPLQREPVPCQLPVYSIHRTRTLKGSLAAAAGHCSHHTYNTPHHCLGSVSAAYLSSLATPSSDDPITCLVNSSPVPTSSPELQLSRQCPLWSPAGQLFIMPFKLQLIPCPTITLSRSSAPLYHRLISPRPQPLLYVLIQHNEAELRCVGLKTIITLIGGW